MSLTTFVYDNITYQFFYNPRDPSGPGCVREIVQHNEYGLTSFKNIRAGHLIDIGANCGVATIILAKQNPESTIYSYEPHLETFELLQKNIELNGLTNVKAFNMAVSNKTTKSITLTTHPHWSGGNTTYADIDTFRRHFGDNSNIITRVVPAIDLDEIISSFHIDSIHLLKIDCEGAEYDILYDSEQFKTKIVKNMVGEFHNLKYNSVDNNNEKLLEYSRNYVDGIVKITMLTI